MPKSTLPYNSIEELPSSFWDKVNKTDDCWLWQAKIDDGYGRWAPPGYKSQFLVHRLAYAVLKNKIDPNLEVDHLCKTRNCINPDHLEAVTSKENTRRGLSKVFDSDPELCPHGHEYDEEVPGKAAGSIYKVCSTCRKANE